MNARALETLQSRGLAQGKADVINLSYGEPVARPNFGRLVELASELVRDHGVVFVSSAGPSLPRALYFTRAFHPCTHSFPHLF